MFYLGGGYRQRSPILGESEKQHHLLRCLRLKNTHRTRSTARNFSPRRLVSNAVYRILHLICKKTGARGGAPVGLSAVAGSRLEFFCTQTKRIIRNP